MVDFPIEGLNLSPYLLNPEESKSKDDCIYDLFGVSQHMGSLSGGHYTAVCKNGIDGNWYDFND